MTQPTRKSAGPWTHAGMGWYTHPSLGGVCLEYDGWHWWPKGKSYGNIGPYRTAKAAMTRAAEEGGGEP